MVETDIFQNRLRKLSKVEKATNFYFWNSRLFLCRLLFIIVSLLVYILLLTVLTTTILPIHDSDGP